MVGLLLARPRISTLHQRLRPLETKSSLAGLQFKAERRHGPLSDLLRGFDLAVVIGAPIFRYYHTSWGRQGCQLLQVTNDPSDAASALVGDSLLGDAKLTLEALLELVEDGSFRTPPKPLNLQRKLPEPQTAAKFPPL